MSRLRTFVERYEHQLSIGSFIVGFIFDSLALKRIDLLFSNILLYTYLTLVVLAIAVLHYRAAHSPQAAWRARILEWVPFVSQFAFGGMFSGFLIFYSQSGSLATSWPFLFFIVALIMTNEFLRKYHARLTFQSLLLFFCLMSFAVYSTPIVLGRMGDDVFLLSGVAALTAFGVFMVFLTLLNYRRVRDSLYHILIGTVGVYGLITTLYFSNILPPIPLALKDAGVYVSVHRVGDHYEAEDTVHTWDEKFFGARITVGQNQPLYAFSSVFAPTKLATSVVHEWQHFNEPTGSWATINSVPFTISGGRDGGYRGYTREERVLPGRWRVNVETVRGQLIGRIVFTVVVSSSTPQTTTRILQ